VAGNSFGNVFRFTTWGESHGPAIGCVVDGTPPRIPLAESDIQYWVDRRKPGQSRFTTQRRESDRVKILSGVFEGMTTGTPISIMIENEDARSKDYAALKETFRPGHADYTYWRKYGIRDYRGGGRASARETASRVAAGAIARKVLGDGITIRGALVQMGPHKIDRTRWDWDAVEDNSFWSPDRQAAQRWEGFLDEVRRAGSSTGAVIEVVASGVPVGLGDPIYDKLDADLCCGIAFRRGKRGRDADGGRRRHVSFQQRRRHLGGHLDRAGHRAPLCREADELDRDAAPIGRHRRPRRRGEHEGAARSLRRHPRRSGRRSDDGDRARRSLAAPARTMRLSAGSRR
jgi:chorismate synthase